MYYFLIEKLILIDIGIKHFLKIYITKKKAISFQVFNHFHNKKKLKNSEVFQIISTIALIF